VEIEKLNEFKSRFNKIVKETLQEENLLPEIRIDSKLKLSEITPKFLKILSQFSPFGPGNMRPVFLSEDVNITGSPRIVGSNHLILTFKQEGCEKVFDAIGFNMGEYCDSLMKENLKVDIVYTIDKTSKDGRVFPQFKLKDIRIKSEEFV
jgi:single-stranded-DNA-specific exonuclease